MNDTTRLIEDIWATPIRDIFELKIFVIRFRDMYIQF